MSMSVTVLAPVTVRPPVNLVTSKALTPVSTGRVAVGAPVTIVPTKALEPVTTGAVSVGAPVTLNATIGRAGLWTGEGPPATIVGSQVGDEYLDTIAGGIYRLDAGV